MGNNLIKLSFVFSIAVVCIPSSYTDILLDLTKFLQELLDMDDTLFLDILRSSDNDIQDSNKEFEQF